MNDEMKIRFQEALTSPKVSQALGFAIAKHGTQKYGEVPYQEHLLKVAGIVYELGRGWVATEDLLCAALLHDTLEDTDATEGEISSMFGGTVLAIVKACSKDDEDDAPKELRSCRRCAFKKTVPALRSVAGAKAVKLADRLANMENSLETRSTHLNMYVREYPEFKSLLWVQGTETTMGAYPELWKRLDAAFEAGVARKK